MPRLGAGPVVYGSHLPLRRAPHDWQLVFEAPLSSDGGTSVPDAAAAYAAPQAWLIFGRGELFMVREIGGAPGFDQVARVRERPRGVPADDLSRGVRVLLPGLRPETADPAKP